MLGAVCDSREQPEEGCEGIKGQTLEWGGGRQGLVCQKCNALQTFILQSIRIYDKLKASGIQTLSKSITYNRHVPRGIMLQSVRWLAAKS